MLIVYGIQLSMNASTPIEFLEQAKSIVERHEELKIAADSLQQSLFYVESQPVCCVHLSVMLSINCLLLDRAVPG